MGQKATERGGFLSARADSGFWFLKNKCSLRNLFSELASNVLGNSGSFTNGQLDSVGKEVLVVINHAQREVVL